MVLREIYIDGFGRHESLSVKPEQGLNLIYSGNEGGKTTLLYFVLGMFYGLNNKRQRLEDSDRERYQPWYVSEARYGGSILFGYDGREYRLERRFGPTQSRDKVVLSDAVSGGEIPLGKQEPGEKLFGMGRSEFEKTIYIGQMSSAVTADEDIRRKLMALSAGGSMEYSPAEMVERLKEARKEYKLFRGQGGLVNELQGQVRALEQESAAARDVAQARRAKEAELTALDADLAARLRTRDALEQVQERLGLRELTERWARLQKQRADLAALVEQVQAGREALGVPAEQELPSSEQVHSAYRTLAAWESTERQLVELRTAQATAEASLAALPAADRLRAQVAESQALRQDYRLAEQAKREWSEAARAEQEAFVAEGRTLDAELARLESEQRLTEELRAEQARQVALAQQLEHAELALQEAEQALAELRAAEEAVRVEGRSREQALKQEEAALESAYQEERAALVGEADERPETASPALLKQPLLLVFLGLAVVALVLLLLRPGWGTGLFFGLMLLGVGFAYRRGRPSGSLPAESAGVQAYLKLEEEQRTKQAALLERREQLQATEASRLEQAGEAARSAERETIRLQELAGSVKKQLDEQVLRVQATQGKLPAEQERPVEERLRELQKQVAGRSYQRSETLQQEEAEGEKVRAALQVRWEALIPTQEGAEPLVLDDEQAEQVQRRYEALSQEREQLVTRVAEHTRKLAELQEAAAADRQVLAEALYGALEVGEQGQPAAYRATLDAYQKQHEAVAGLLHLQAERQRQLDEALAGRSWAELEAEAQQADEALEQTPLDPAWAERTEAEVTEELRALNREIQALEGQVAALQQEILELTRQARVPQAIDEELEAALAALQEAQQALADHDLAIELIEQANERMQQTFGPLINDATTRILAQLTGEPEQKVQVDREFRLRVEEPGSRTMREHAYYSGGKIDQLYMALRLALAETVYQAGGPVDLPFLIDDAFTQYDAARTASALNYLKALADGGKQILYATCIESYREQAEAQGLHVIEL